MQVATLFRESATLLGASMESGGVSVGPVSGIQDPSINNPGLVQLTGHIDNFNHPNNNKFTLNMKLESQDDGYETSADLMLSNTTNNHNDSLKCDSAEDPYSFIDEDPIMSVMPPQAPTPTHHIGPQGLTTCSVPSMAGLAPHVGLPIGPKKRGRKKKIKNEPGMMMGANSPQTPSDYEVHHLGGHGSAMTNGTTIPKLKERKKHDRFNGMPEEEVSKRTLPDHLATNLDIIIIGINPGLFAAYKGHHYAGPGNHFWKCLYLSGLTPEQMTADEDYKLLQVGIGFTNMVQRPTKGSADLTRKEIKEGCQTLLEKLQRFKPKIAVFNGKLIYEVFSGKKDFSFGRQPDLVDGTNTYMWVMPSSSARCAQLPRAADKVPFYAALKKFRDYLNGIVTNIDDSEVVFSDAKLKSCCDADAGTNKDALYSMDLMDLSNAVVKKEDAATVIPCKKKRGRPKKIKTDTDEPTPPKATPRKQYNQQNNNSNCDFPKKKRGRPKKIKCDEIDHVIQNGERNTQTPNCFSSPSPIQSPTNFCHMINAQMTPPNNYNNNNIHQQSYQSPRPHSQPFTHSDLSSEISAAISSDHLGSPAPTSPSLGPPDFDPPTSMPTEDNTTECRFSSPAPSSASEQPNSSSAYPSYHTFGSMEHHSESAIHYSQAQQQQQSVEAPSSGGATLRGEFTTKAQDMSSKSLSGLESLVDQIPNIAEGGEAQAHAIHLAEGGDPYPGLPYPNYPQRTSPGSSPAPHTSPYSYLLNNNSNSYNVTSLSTSNNSFSVNNLTSNYGHTSPTSSYQHNLMGNSFIDHHSCTMPQMALPPYPQLPYGQQFSNAYPPAPPPGLHVPSPNYPSSYYNASYVQAQPNSSTPGYLHSHMFERIRPDIGYGGF